MPERADKSKPCWVVDCPPMEEVHIRPTLMLDGVVWLQADPPPWADLITAARDRGDFGLA
jgi:hypothetical protein